MDRRSALKFLSLNSAILPFVLHAAENTKITTVKYLILIELKGGNDGLNTVIPYSNPLYYKLRPTISIPANKVLPIDNQLGFHPSLEGLKNIFDQNELAIIQGVGYPRPSRSHFRSIDIWNTASRSDQYLERGWLDTLMPKVETKLKGIILGGEYGPFSGMDNDVIKIRNIEDFLSRSEKIKAHLKMTGDNKALTHILRTEVQIRESADMFYNQLINKEALKHEFQKTDFGIQLQIATRLINSKIKIPYLKLSLGSFDTHVNQPKQHARLLKQLSDGIMTLRDNLIASEEWENTLIMTYSEFGRRVAENAGNGTDHGTAASHFVTGGKVKGGLYGQEPALESLDVNGDLKFTLDFRSLYHTISKEWNNTSSSLLSDFLTIPFLRT